MIMTIQAIPDLLRKMSSSGLPKITCWQAEGLGSLLNSLCHLFGNACVIGESTFLITQFFKTISLSLLTKSL